MKPIIFFGKEISIHPIAISIGSLHIYWYGILIAFALALQIFFLKMRTKEKEKSFGISYDSIIDFSFGAIFWGFLCARIYYVIFNLAYYRENPMEIIAIWNGGIAIYGGIIGAVLYAIYFTKKKKISFWNLADLLIPHLALAQSIGRWGNFVNQEAYGTKTLLPWKMGIYDTTLQEYIFVHPTFLYESILTFCIFVILILLSKNRKFEGQIFSTYMILYGIGRAMIEGLRTDSLMFLGLRVSQLLGIVLAVIFTVFYGIKLTNLGKCGKNEEKE